MTFESITIPVEPEKQDLTQLNIEPISNLKEKVESVHGKYLFTSLKPDQKIIFNHRLHPVFEGFIWAYKNHRPITISPDIIWLLIAQAFSNHVSDKSEELRSMFVNFSGKKELTVTREDLNFYEIKSEDWEQNFFPEFVKQISEYTSKDIVDTMTPDFSTTTPVSLAVGQLTIMSTMKHYFNYRCRMAGCGFPHITIEGSIEDWSKIIDKLTFLKKYKFEWFSEKVVDIINKIIETKKGKIDTQFWKEMIRIKDGHGFYKPGYVDGWFTSFFPFNSNGERLNGSKISDKTKLQNEMQKIPFVLEIIGERTFKCNFWAGFVGLTQDEKTASIKPEIGWFINEETANTKPEIGWFIKEETENAGSDIGLF